MLNTAIASWTRNIAIIALIVSVIAGCNNKSSDVDDNAGKDSVEQADTVIKTKVKKVFKSIPSPLQVSALLKQAGAKYVGGILNPAKNAGKYSTNYSKALATGVYGTDLAYANMFNQTQQSIIYMEAIAKVSSGLGLTSMFSSSKLLKRFEDNMNNQDSLFTIISELYRETDESLKENEQRNSAALILAGGWIEGLYIATNLAKTNPSKDMNSRIAELKFSLSALLDMLAEFEGEAEFKGITEDLTSLGKTYESVEIKYEKKDPVTDEKSQVTTIGSSSQASLSDAQLKELTSKVAALRNKIVTPN